VIDFKIHVTNSRPDIYFYCITALTCTSYTHTFEI